MIKTLRITSVIAVILAGGFLVFPVLFGVRGDEQIGEFLSSAGAIEKFKEARSDKAERSENQTSPLVRQAEAFASYLNPPLLAEPTAARSPIARRPTTVSAKFELVGTSFYPLHPERSLALIDEPGKGLHWVRQSGRVGRLIVEQIKDGLVVVRDGQRSFELVAERPGKRTLVKGPSVGETASRAISAASGKTDAGAPILQKDRKMGTPATTSTPGTSDEPVQEEDYEDDVDSMEVSEMEDFLSRLQAMRADVSEEDDSEDLEENIVWMQELVAELKGTHVSPEEANKLRFLGRELKDIIAEPNWADDRKIETAPNSVEPNSPADE